MRLYIVKRPILLSLLIAYCFVSCKQYYDENTIVEFPENIQLQGVHVGTENVILSPYRMARLDSYLIITDPVPNKQTNCMIYLYCTEENRIVKNFGSFGDGPGELKDVSDFFVDEKKREIVVFDQIRKNFLHYNLDSLLLFETYKPTLVSAPLGMFSIYRFCKPNDTLYLTNGAELNLLTLFTSKGNIQYEIREFPIVDLPTPGFKTNIQGEALKTYLFGQLAFCNTHSRVVIAYMNFDLIEVYNLKGERLKFVKNPTHYAPYVKNEIINYNMCYFDNKIFDDKIYLLYSGKKLARDADGWKQGDIIQVFDMDLNPIRKYQLDTPITSFALDCKNRRIYGVNRFSAQPITMFNL